MHDPRVLLGTKAGEDAGRLKKQAGQDAARVGYLHRSTKDELRRLAALLNSELERPDPTDSPPAGGVDDDNQGTARLQRDDQGAARPQPDNESSGTAASNH